MDKKIMEKYLRMVPIEIRIPVKKLKNDQTWAVYIALMNEKPKFYGQLEEQFKANPTEMSRALKALVEGGLVDRTTEKFNDIGNSKKVFYSPTPLGKKFYDMLFDTIIPTEVTSQDQKQKQGLPSIDWLVSGGKEPTHLQTVSQHYGRRYGEKISGSTMTKIEKVEGGAVKCQ